MSWKVWAVWFICFTLFVSGLYSEEKIFYVDLEYVYEQSILKPQAQKSYEAKREQIEGLLKKTRQALKQKKRYLEVLADLLGHEEYTDVYESHRKEIEVHEAEIKKARKNFSIWKKENEKELLEEVMLAIESIAESEDAKIILLKQPTVIYSDKSLDISERVIDLLNLIDPRDTITAK